MDQKIENFMSMCGATDDLLTAEIAIVGGVIALKNGHLTLKNEISVVKAFQMIQETNLSGWAARKGSVKADMIIKSMKIVDGVSAFALTTGDEVLAGEMNYTTSKLEVMRDEQVDVACKLINAKATAVGAPALADYNLVAADLTDQTAAIGLYAAVKQMPSGKVDERQAAKKGVEDTVVLLRKNFEVMDKVVNTMGDSEPEFVKKYFNAREIYDLGVRHEKPAVPPVGG